jgi:hypothetical protein
MIASFALAAPRRQLVDLDVGGRGQLAADEDRGLLQALQPLVSTLALMPGRPVLQFAEAAGAIHQLAHDQHRPALAYQLQRERRAAGIVIPPFRRPFFRVSHFF